MANNGLQIFSADDMLKSRLKLMNYSSKKIDGSKRSSNEERFKGHFGSSSYILAAIVNNMQATEIAEAKVESQDFNIKFFYGYESS